MSSHVVLGLVLLTLLGYTPGCLCESECGPPAGITEIQSHCKEANEAMSLAESQRDFDKTCKSLFDFYKCIAAEVPRCLSYAMEIHSLYLESPFECDLTAEQIRELQKMHIKHTEGPSTPAPSPSKNQATPTREVEKEEGGAYTVEGTGTKSPPKNGSKESQRADEDNNSAPVRSGQRYLLILAGLTYVAANLLIS